MAENEHTSKAVASNAAIALAMTKEVLIRRANEDPDALLKLIHSIAGSGLTKARDHQLFDDTLARCGEIFGTPTPKVVKPE